jgi:hypothetical protein
MESGEGSRVLARGYGRTQCVSPTLTVGFVTHRMRVRLTVRYRTFGRAADQVLFFGSELYSPFFERLKLVLDEWE